MITLRSLIQENILWEQWSFPGGEIGVRILDKLYPGDHYLITVDGLVKSEDLFVLSQLVDAIHRDNSDNGGGVTVYMPYLPYARQDRVCNDGEAAACQVFCTLLSTINFDKIIVKDVHSTQALSSLIETVGRERVIHVTQEKIVADLLKKYTAVVYPDEGASKKSKPTVGLFPIVMTKTRVTTGVIHNPLRQEQIDILLGQNVKEMLVVDDICDGGRTFISAAETIKKSLPDITLDLYVTHGIFSQGVDELLKHFERIYCHNIMNDDVKNRVIRVV